LVVVAYAACLHEALNYESGAQIFILHPQFFLNCLCIFYLRLVCWSARFNGYFKGYPNRFHIQRVKLQYGLIRVRFFLRVRGIKLRHFLRVFFIQLRYGVITWWIIHKPRLIPAFLTSSGFTCREGISPLIFS